MYACTYVHTYVCSYLHICQCNIEIRLEDSEVHAALTQGPRPGRQEPGSGTPTRSGAATVDASTGHRSCFLLFVGLFMFLYSQYACIYIYIYIYTHTYLCICVSMYCEGEQTPRGFKRAWMEESSLSNRGFQKVVF